MSLKDRIARDVTRVYLNKKHYASVHAWNGRKFTCIVDEDEALKRKNNNVLDVSWDANTAVIVLHASVEELPRVIPNEVILFDNKPYKVSDVQTAEGMRTVTLSNPDAKAVTG